MVNHFLSNPKVVAAREQLDVSKRLEPATNALGGKLAPVGKVFAAINSWAAHNQLVRSDHNKLLTSPVAQVLRQMRLACC